MKGIWIVIIITILIVGGVVGYIVFLDKSPRRNGDFRGFNMTMQLDDVTKNKIISFFENTSDLEDIKSYFEENRFHCGYYCREVNQDHKVCDLLQRLINRSFRPK